MNTRQFVVEHNVKLFVEGLSTEEDLGRRENLLRLLLTEVDKFARLSEREECLDRWTMECEDRVARIRRVMAEQATGASNTFLAQRALKNLVDLRAVLRSQRRVLNDQIDKSVI